MFLSSVIVLPCLITTISAVNFDWEEVQLTEVETRNYSAIQFAHSSIHVPQEECKTIPGDPNWPSGAEWARFNNTLGGVLVKPRPLAAVCYSGPEYDAERCEALNQRWKSPSFHANDPASVMSQWAIGNACVPTSDPNSTCEQGGYPAYVVNATTVRHIQLAVNFARNLNIRLVIKASGHDFNGKNIGAYSLSVWTHSLRSFTYHATYNTSRYTGRAIAYGAGFRSLDAHTVTSQYNMSMMIAGGLDVSLAGGYLQGGGHSSLSSSYGLAADQVLSIEAVTASGKFVHADAETNGDLFWAFRGGGGGNYGIITSVIVKAFPPTPMTQSRIMFSTIPSSATSNSTAPSVEAFWKGVKAYWDFCIALCDAKGLGYNFIQHTPIRGSNATGLTFTTTISVPNYNNTSYQTFTRPLLDKLTALGITVPIPKVSRSLHIPPTPDPNPNYHHPSISRRALGDIVSNTLIASRWFQHPHFASPSALTKTHLAIRHFVEAGGYTFHGINHAPTLQAAGYPDNAVNPAFRSVILHAQGYLGDMHWDGQSPVISTAELAEKHERLQRYMQGWRDVTPGSGSYVNEGDAQEPDFKDSFFGENYERLADVKRRWDPWGVFWVVGGVGSDEWEVRGGSGTRGFVVQDGRLCRVGWEGKGR
ncbi:hypothetical protein BCR34DRAFT_473261 [Clohesyomyces aquaticus]|uniref:FAD-binding PCMH-type domain-containing protein n=1 Tax=Clohesyomyces aquaticus TaxID=1231657 RepID=A0A1Y2A7T4_9PLEO|nr:hypothetical protein BCR34DRAFT_473261 [Clohesyomyces aquaticus]